jgi:hypothetical protein
MPSWSIETVRPIDATSELDTGAGRTACGSHRRRPRQQHHRRRTWPVDGPRADVNAGEEGSLVIARIATFEGGDAEEMRRLNNEILVERAATALPPGVLRVMVLMKDEGKWSVISFFDSEDAAAAAEQRFEQMGDEIPESVRGKRISVESFEVAFDVEMVR